LTFRSFASSQRAVPGPPGAADATTIRLMPQHRHGASSCCRPRAICSRSSWTGRASSGTTIVARLLSTDQLPGGRLGSQTAIWEAGSHTLSAVIQAACACPTGPPRQPEPPGSQSWAELILTVRRNEHDLDHVWGTCWDHKRFESFQPSGQISVNHPSAS
jgi:hypothetical protein